MTPNLSEALSRFLNGLNDWITDASSGSNDDTQRLTIPEADRLDEEAHRLAHRSDLTRQEAFIVVASREGYDDGEIGKEIGRGSMTVKRKRERLRERRMDAERLDGELDDV